MKAKLARTAFEYGVITVATLLLVVGVYFFKFPNNFSFGGVTGIAVVLSAMSKASASSYTFIINMALLVLGFLFLGKSFGAKTVSAPLTTEPVLELIFAIFLPALSAAILFNIGASGGGTDIIAMILKKYTSVPIGTALFLVDCVIVISSCFVFDIQTGLFSLTGLLAKSLVIDNVIESINRCKVFLIVCDNPDPICEFIYQDLKRSATVYKAHGAFTHNQKMIIMSVMKRGQAVQLRNFVKRYQPGAFIAIVNSSEIIGKGFRGLN